MNDPIRKLLAALFAGALVFGAAACDDDEAENDEILEEEEGEVGEE